MDASVYLCPSSPSYLPPTSTPARKAHFPAHDVVPPPRSSAERKAPRVQPIFPYWQVVPWLRDQYVKECARRNQRGKFQPLPVCHLNECDPQTCIIKHFNWGVYFCIGGCKIAHVCLRSSETCPVYEHRDCLTCPFSGIIVRQGVITDGDAMMRHLKSNSKTDVTRLLGINDGVHRPFLPEQETQTAEYVFTCEQLWEELCFGQKRLQLDAAGRTSMNAMFVASSIVNIDKTSHYMHDDLIGHHPNNVTLVSAMAVLDFALSMRDLVRRYVFNNSNTRRAKDQKRSICKTLIKESLEWLRIAAARHDVAEWRKSKRAQPMSGRHKRRRELEVGDDDDAGEQRHKSSGVIRISLWFLAYAFARDYNFCDKDRTALDVVIILPLFKELALLGIEFQDVHDHKNILDAIVRRTRQQQS